MLDRSLQPVLAATGAGAEATPILIVPFMWIGDFVRCHTVVRLLKARWPQRPVDVLTNTLTAPLLDYMPGVRQGIVSDLPRRRLALWRQQELASRLRSEGYGSALIMPRTWKAVLAPYLAGIPERIGYVGEARFFLLTEARWGERKLARMVDQCAALALPEGHPLPDTWPVPELVVPAVEVASWRHRRGLPEDGRPVIAFAPGSVAASRRWPPDAYAELARGLSAQGFSIWVLGGPAEKQLASSIVAGNGPSVRDLTGSDLRDAVLALAAADVAVSNDSGLLHVAAAIGTPSIGIFGPTSPWLWAPLNPLAGTVAATTELPCRPCHKPVCRYGHQRCMQDIPAPQVLAAVERTLATAGLAGRT
jgi:heptosyltransferase-2